MTKILINGRETDVPPDFTLLQAAESVGIEVPRFCFHERLSVAGNCRMCLMEVKGSPKPVASCAWTVRDCRPGPNGEPPEIFTATPTVKKARKGVLEFLLINHPLDCPICDQGGECDLQDETIAYGMDHNRFYENKRAVEDKYLGPLVKTSMNRCIQCTRCVRFLAEVAGVPELGATGRSEDMEITTYLEAALTSELQGNVIDLCPVGALTSKPYAFKARPWELEHTESVDVMDAVGSNIRVDTRGPAVMRILPRLNEELNEEWITDKTRFHWDGLATQRLDRSYVRVDGKLQPASWPEAFRAVAAKLDGVPGSRIAALAGDLATAEEMFALGLLMDRLGSPNLDSRQDGTKLDPALGRASYLFNPSVDGIEDADCVLIVGSNPRTEASLLNTRVRKRWRTAGVRVGMIGAEVDLTYPYEYLGAGPASLAAIERGEGDFAAALRAAKKPVVLVGQGALTRPDGQAVLAAAARLAAGDRADGWNGLGVLHHAAARVGGLDVGFVPRAGGLGTNGIVQAAVGGRLDVLFLLGADELPSGTLGPTFVVYIGSHGDAGAHRADVILPGAAYTEKNGTYVNTEGRVQLAKRAAFPPGEAREDWAVLRALSDVIGHRLPFDSFEALRAAMHKAVPHLAQVDVLPKLGPESLASLGRLGGELGREAFRNAIADYYLTNPIARASKTMAECSAMAVGMLQAAE
ncbi:MAG: NADH-quinone oxidoreductase subunit G [Bauldia sp.]|nr:NADH-quinone oxidoreductase subunit G [Bauldia sp.]